MKAMTCLALVATGAFACAHTDPTPPASPPKSSSASNDPNRALTESECQSLGQELADKCRDRPSSRSARIEGWCSELLRGMDNGSWVAHDCVEHIRYMDSECMRSATNVPNMMDCESAAQ
jgi:hypothetical protein